MQVFTRCAGRDGAQVLLADPWETVWSVKQRSLERHGATGACADVVRPCCLPRACQSPKEHVCACVIILVDAQGGARVWQPLLGWKSVQDLLLV